MINAARRFGQNWNSAAKGWGLYTMSRNSGIHTGPDGLRLRQHTLKSQINCSGTGLHSGDQMSMTLHPAPAGTGIVFRRSDLGGAEVPALWDRVVDTRLCTALGDGKIAAPATTITMSSPSPSLSLNPNLRLSPDLSLSPNP